MKLRAGKPLIIIMLLAVLATLLGIYKFSPCAGNGWATPAQYVHACYSDIPALYGARALDKDQWSYSSPTDAVEYPVITGAIMYILALATTPSDNEILNYYKINIGFLAILFIIIAIIVYKIRPQFAYLATLAPASIASLYINWDLWAIVSMMLSIYWFDRKKYKCSAVAIGISISTKFLPIFLLLPIVLILWRHKQIKEILRYITITFITFTTINLPVLLTTPKGWLRFYELNFDRGPDWGSLWYAASSLGINVGNANISAILALFLSVIIVTIVISLTKEIITLADINFIVLGLVMMASKVYSPQYVLWLVPLAVIAINHRKELHAFWIWQVGEVIYHIAIWQHLATVTGATYGLPLGPYSVITLIRVLACGYLIAVLINSKFRKASTEITSV